jgi:hypothetical protein
VNSNETWEVVFDEKDVNKTFNIFLNIFLRICYQSFPLIQTNKQSKVNSWITPGILISCKHKRELYRQLWNNNNNYHIITSHYKKYSKLLTMVIKKAKRMEYDKLIVNSHNKIEITWNIINTESGRNKNSNNIQVLIVEGRKIVDQQSIAETFNEYFATIAENIRKQIKYTHMHIYNNDGEKSYSIH